MSKQCVCRVQSWEIRESNGSAMASWFAYVYGSRECVPHDVTLSMSLFRLLLFFFLFF